MQVLFNIQKRILNVTANVLCLLLKEALSFRRLEFQVDALLYWFWLLFGKDCGGHWRWFEFG
jgi:hypothetical protein